MNLLSNLVHEHSYLGYTIIDNNADDATMKAQIRGIYAKGNMIYTNFKKCSMEVKIQLFKTLFLTERPPV